MPDKPKLQQREPMSDQEHAAMMLREKTKRQSREKRIKKLVEKSKAKRAAYSGRGYKEPVADDEGDDNAEVGDEEPDADVVDDEGELIPEGDDNAES